MEECIYIGAVIFKNVPAQRYWSGDTETRKKAIGVSKEENYLQKVLLDVATFSALCGKLEKVTLLLRHFQD